MGGESFLEFLDAQQPPVDDTWKITDDHLAMWAIRKIAAAEQAVAERQAVVLQEQARLSTWHEQAIREAMRTREFFSAKLHGYLLRLQESGKLGKKKSWALPNGTLQLRALAEKYEVKDEAVLMAWAEQSGAVRVELKPDMTIVRQCLSEGVEVPGMVLARPASEAFRVQLHDDQKENGR